MTSTKTTYQNFSKIIMMIFVWAVLLPTGIHAKTALDYCMLNMSQAEASSDCCPSQNDQSKDECDWKTICACNLDVAPLADSEWTHPIQPEIKVDDNGCVALLYPKSEIIGKHSYLSPIRHAPPIYVLNSTFLN
jgi:hypothetical protein